MTDVQGFREVLRGAERDAAVEAAIDWLRSHQGAPTLSEIADRFNLSLTASGEALFKARRAIG